MLNAPLPGEKKATPAEREQEGEGFMAAMAALSGMGVT